MVKSIKFDNNNKAGYVMMKISVVVCLVNLV